MAEHWSEQLIREAIERGELEPHEGVGEPIPDLDNDPNWWVKKWFDREGSGKHSSAKGSRGGKNRGTL